MNVVQKCLYKSREKMEPKMKLENVLSMNGGNGKLSYADNSRYQESCLRFLQPFLEECIAEMRLIPCESFCIADLGCSVGRNTLFVADTISHAVRKKYSSSMPMPDLHVFFSDLPSNDFNLLLQDIHNNNATSRPCKYFAAAVAGSFYRRLFPKRSLDFVHSSYSLQILSRVPPEIEDRNSRSWNGEGVFITKGGAPEVAGAYLRQFQEDFSSFLRARAEEVCEGGRMFLFTVGREGSDPTDQGNGTWLAEKLNSAFDDVLASGDHLIDRRTIQNINLPIFYPCVDEVRCEVEKEGSFREIRIQFLRQELKSDAVRMEYKADGIGRRIANPIRIGSERLLASHFGEDVVDAVFERFAVRVQQDSSSALRLIGQIEGVLAVLERTSIST